MSHSTYSPAKARAAERRRRAWELRIAGYTYAEIARAIGVSRARATQYVSEGMKKLHQDIADLVAHYRSLALARYERLFRALWPAISKGDTKAIAAAVPILRGISRLLGLDEPTRVVAKVSGHFDNWTEEELLGEAERLGIPIPTPPPALPGPVPLPVPSTPISTEE